MRTPTTSKSTGPLVHARLRVALSFQDASFHQSNSICVSEVELELIEYIVASKSSTAQFYLERL